MQTYIYCPQDGRIKFGITTAGEYSPKEKFQILLEDFRAAIEQQDDAEIKDIMLGKPDRDGCLSVEYSRFDELTDEWEDEAGELIPVHIYS